MWRRRFAPFGAAVPMAAARPHAPQSGRRWLPVVGAVGLLASALLVPLTVVASAGATEGCVAPTGSPSASSSVSSSASPAASPTGAPTAPPKMSPTVVRTDVSPVFAQPAGEDPGDPIIATRTPAASQSPTAAVSQSPTAMPCPTHSPSTAAPTGTVSPTGTESPSGTVSPSVTGGPSPSASASGPAAARCADLRPISMMRAQEPLVDGAEQLLAAGGPLAGFAGITVEPETCTVRVYWDGPLPGNVTAIVNQLRTRMEVLVHDGPRYTHAELTAIADNLFDTLYQGMNPDVLVTRVSVPPEGTHVDVGVWPLPSTPESPVDAAFRAQQFWGPVFPVHVTAVPPVPVASRWDDIAPWKAGGQHRSGTGTCSTGWPMGHSDDRSFILTAAHCARAAYGTPVSNGANSAVIGTIEGFDPGMDTALILVPRRADIAPRMWDGGVSDVQAPLGVNDEVEFTKPIVDWSETFKGMYLCTSGSSTGAHCDLKVTDNDVSYTNDLGWKVKKSAHAKQVDGKVAIGKGDSGGPVFSLTGENADVVAGGLIAAGQQVVPCGAHPTTICYADVYFTRLDAIRTNWGLSNLTTGGLK
jgi:hypothetical protein